MKYTVTMENSDSQEEFELPTEIPTVIGVHPTPGPFPPDGPQDLLPVLDCVVGFRLQDTPRTPGPSYSANLDAKSAPGTNAHSYVLIPLFNHTADVANLVDANKPVIFAPSIRVCVRNPLEAEHIFCVRPAPSVQDNGTLHYPEYFTRATLIRAAAELYLGIFAAENFTRATPYGYNKSYGGKGIFGIRLDYTPDNLRLHAVFYEPKRDLYHFSVFF